MVFDDVAAGGIGGGNRDDQAGDLQGETLRREQENRQQAAYLAEAAAGQQRQNRRLLRQGQRLARRGAVRMQGEGVCQRMADETRIDAVAFVDRRFHREQAEHAVGAFADLLRALLPPGPDRRADVVHGADAGGFQLPLQAEVEIGRVDADKNVRFPSEQALA